MKIKIECPCCKKSISFKLFDIDLKGEPSISRCPKCGDLIGFAVKGHWLDCQIEKVPKPKGEKK